LLLPIFSQDFDLSLKMINAITYAPAIHFKFGLSRASTSDTAGQTRECRAVTAEARKAVLELREFYLDLSGAALRPAAENIQDQLRPIDDLELREIGDRCRLGRREILLEDEVLDAVLQGFNDDLFEFAAAQ